MSFSFWASVLLKPPGYGWKVTLSISCGFLGGFGFSSGLLMLFAFFHCYYLFQTVAFNSCICCLPPQAHSSFQLSANPDKTPLTCAYCRLQTIADGSGLFVHFSSLPHHMKFPPGYDLTQGFTIPSRCHSFMPCSSLSGAICCLLSGQLKTQIPISLVYKVIWPSLFHLPWVGWKWDQSIKNIKAFSQTNNSNHKKPISHGLKAKL